MARMSGGTYGPYPGFDVGELARRRYVDLLRQKAGLWPGDRLLDVQCGHGSVSHAIAKAFTKAHVTATEEDDGFFARAVENAGKEDLSLARLQLVRAVPDDLPFKDERFLVTTCALGLSAAEDPVAVLHEIHRVTEFHGKVLLVDVDLTRAPRKPRGVARNVLDDDLLAEMKEIGFGKVKIQRIALLQGGTLLKLVTAKRGDPEEDEEHEDDEETAPGDEDEDPESEAAEA